MGKYKLGHACGKCGERGAKSEYNDGQPTARMMDVFGGPPDDFEPEETIKRTCNNCGYIWMDEVLTP